MGPGQAACPSVWVLSKHVKSSALKQRSRAGGVAQGVEHLPTKCSSNIEFKPRYCLPSKKEVIVSITHIYLSFFLISTKVKVK
jgi:hypothetical protein